MNFRWLIVIVPVLTAGAEAGQELGAEYEKLSWFLHITDLHISSRDQARLADLATFVTEVLAVIQPEFVMCGGDLTEARTGNPLVTGQIPWEWETYRQTAPLSLVQVQRGSALIGRELQSVATPVIVCHKEPVRASKAPY